MSTIQSCSAEGQVRRTRLSYLIAAAVVPALGLAALPPPPVFAQEKKPNILIIWGDDIGGFNINAYNQGLMGYRTPNIDRIAKDGAMFTDWYGQQSYTAPAGRIHHRPITDPDGID